MSFIHGFLRFGRHVVFIMLGKHFACHEHTAIIKFSLSDNTLTLLKEVRKNTLVFRRDHSSRISDPESHGHAVGQALN